MGNIDTADLFDTIKGASALQEESAQGVQDRLRNGAITESQASGEFANLEASQGWNDTLAEVRKTVDTKLKSAEVNIATQRDRLGTPTGSTADQQLAETRHGRVWPTLFVDLEKANGSARLDATIDAVKGAQPSARPLLVQDLVPYLLKKGFAQDSIDKLFLRPLFPKFAKALDDLDDDRRAAPQVWHNLNVAEARTKAGLKYNRNLAQHWVEPVNA